MATCYEFGHGVPRNVQYAAQLHRKAAEEGCAESMKSIGCYSLHGHYIEPNHCLAFRMLRKAVALEVGGAKGELAKCYDRGIGVERDVEKSFKEGSMFCIPELARCYNVGSGVEKNAEDATKLYRKCIQGGTWLGDYYKGLLGLRLVQGLGVEKDEPRVKAMILDSTNSGNAIGWYGLAECYRHGYG